MTQVLQLDRVSAAEVRSAPYPHFIVGQAIRDELLPGLLDDFPAIREGGSFPLASLESGPLLEALLRDLDSPAFRRLIEEKLAIDLGGRPIAATARGWSRAKDGRIHTDSKSKLVTVLIYFNREWPHAEGRLRVLRDSRSMEDYAAEIPPTAGALLAFRVTDDCWHGYPAFEGPRQSIQINFVADQKAVGKHQRRHALSARLKALKSLFTR